MTTRQTKRGRPFQDRHERGPGRARPLGADVLGFQRRLKEFIKRRYGSVYEFAKTARFANSTVQSWTNPGKPKIADAASLLPLARETKVSLNWLLLGEGPELLGETVSSGELAEDLRRTVIAELISSRYARTSVLEALVPPGEELLEGVLQDCRRRIPADRRVRSAMQRALETLAGGRATFAGAYGRTK